MSPSGLCLQKAPMPSPAIFLDRDGVLIANRADYVRRWGEAAILPGVPGALARLAAGPWPIVVVTNQSCIGRGLVAARTVQGIHRRLRAALAAQGGRIDAFYTCPHTPDAGCACRKPQPGLLLQAAQELDLDLAASYLVGDAVGDVQAALAVGAQPLLVLTGRGAAQAQLLTPHQRAVCPVVADLAAAVGWILADYAGRKKNASPTMK
ncbi:MAG: HAD-IIIA family hydrolase [Chloroflexi bacterium]|nr:HAD-IIIA family hydrolase [Chloroflexota bacterium]